MFVKLFNLIINFVLKKSAKKIENPCSYNYCC